MNHGTPAAYAAHRKAGEKPCDECRADANRRSKESRARKAERRAQVTGQSVEAKVKKAVSLRDYAADLVRKDLSNYTHKVVLQDGRDFSIHTSPEAAAIAAEQVRGEVVPFVPNPTTYWNSNIGARYDH